MNAQQLAEFERRTQAFDEALTPLSVTIGGVVYAASGSVAEERFERLELGGSVLARECHFTVAKVVLPVPPAIGDLVEILGLPFEVVKVGGLDPYDPNWSFRVERGFQR